MKKGNTIKQLNAMRSRLGRTETTTPPSDSESDMEPDMDDLSDDSASEDEDDTMPSVTAKGSDLKRKTVRSFFLVINPNQS